MFSNSFIDSNPIWLAWIGELLQFPIFYIPSLNNIFNLIPVKSWKSPLRAQRRWRPNPRSRTWYLVRTLLTTCSRSDGRLMKDGTNPRLLPLRTSPCILEPRFCIMLRNSSKAWRPIEEWMTKSECSDPCTTWPEWTSLLNVPVCPLLMAVNSSNVSESKLTLFARHGLNFEWSNSCLRLIQIDQEWVPHCTSSSLYIRPTLIGTEAALGVSPANEAELYVILCPVGPYFATGLKPVNLLADPNFIRAWPGGCGFAKMGSNYAPTLWIGVSVFCDWKKMSL